MNAEEMGMKRAAYWDRVTDWIWEANREESRVRLGFLAWAAVYMGVVLTEMKVQERQRPSWETGMSSVSDAVSLS